MRAGRLPAPTPRNGRVPPSILGDGCFKVTQDPDSAEASVGSGFASQPLPGRSTAFHKTFCCRRVGEQGAAIFGDRDHILVLQPEPVTRPVEKRFNTQHHPRFQRAIVPRAEIRIEPREK